MDVKSVLYLRNIISVGRIAESGGLAECRSTAMSDFAVTQVTVFTLLRREGFQMQAGNKSLATISHQKACITPQNCPLPYICAHMYIYTNIHTLTN